MPFSVVVLCVLCAFVVKNPLSAALLHRTCMMDARISTTSRLDPARPQPQCRAPIWGIFRPSYPFHLCWSQPTHDMFILDVIKCTYLYRQLPLSAVLPPSSLILHPFKCGEGGTFLDTPCRYPSSVLRPPSTVPHPPSLCSLTILDYYAHN